MSLKKFRKPDRDEWRALLIVVRQSEVRAFESAAAGRNMTVGEWARAVLQEAA